jgi:hypothetical protein
VLFSAFGSAGKTKRRNDNEEASHSDGKRTKTTGLLGLSAFAKRNRYPASNDYGLAWDKFLDDINMMLPVETMKMRSHIRSLSSEEKKIPDCFRVGTILYFADCFAGFKLSRNRTSIQPELKWPNYPGAVQIDATPNLQYHQVNSEKAEMFSDFSWALDLSTHIRDSVEFGDIDLQVVMITAGVPELNKLVIEKNGKELDQLAADFLGTLAWLSRELSETPVVFIGAAVHTDSESKHPARLLNRVNRALKKLKIDEPDVYRYVQYHDVVTLNYPESIYLDYGRKPEKRGFVEKHLLQQIPDVLSITMLELLEDKEHLPSAMKNRINEPEEGSDSNMET